MPKLRKHVFGYSEGSEVGNMPARLIAVRSGGAFWHRVCHLHGGQEWQFRTLVKFSAEGLGGLGRIEKPSPVLATVIRRSWASWRAFREWSYNANPEFGYGRRFWTLRGAQRAIERAIMEDHTTVEGYIQSVFRRAENYPELL